MAWQMETIKKYTKDVFSSAALYLVISIILALQFFIAGKEFQWIAIEPLEAPSIFIRIFYSALTFVTIGALLYKIRFYQFLYYVLGNWKSFKEAKALIWIFLLYFMYSWVVPKFFSFANWVLSFFFNIFRLILYIAPSIGISIAIFLVGLFIYKQIKNRHKQVSGDIIIKL